MARQKTRIVMHFLLHPNMNDSQIVHKRAPFDENGFVSKRRKQLEVLDPVLLFLGVESVPRNSAHRMATSNGIGWASDVYRCSRDEALGAVMWLKVSMMLSSRMLLNCLDGAPESDPVGMLSSDDVIEEYHDENEHQTNILCVWAEHSSSERDVTVVSLRLCPGSQCFSADG